MTPPDSTHPGVSTPPAGPDEGTNELIARGCRIAADFGLGLSPSRVSRIIRRDLKAGATTAQVVRCLRAYADPTGDTAVRSVMRDSR